VTRYRCAACGNLTRFDVTSTATTRAFYHFTLGGELQIEDEEVIDEQVHDVRCRWCGHGRSIEVIEEPEPSDRSSPL
jgi:DNA-directed RNA polymerase subunit RPC12/RpoP